MALPGLSSIMRSLNMPAFTKAASKAPDAPPPKLSVSEQAAKEAKQKRVGDDAGASFMVAGMVATSVMGITSQLSQQAVNAENAKLIAETKHCTGYVDAIKTLNG